KIVHGGLRVDTREALAVGGDSGPAVIPGNVEESLLLSAMRHESFEMPPEGKLPDHVIADFEQWIQRGAADPREGEPLAAAPSYDWEQARQFWAYRPLVPVTPPDVGDSTWPRTEMDRFVWQGYESQGLSPGEDASRQTLVRRLYFDLIGLPPSEAELANSDEPIETLVDRLLASPRFGERWGRHWLDVARFAESTGGGRSRVLHEAWRYRDYVLDAFNCDKPFDEFVVEQIAGDLLSSESNEQRAEQLAATSFLALGPINYELQDKELLRMEVIDEQIDTIGRALLGQTIGCARCHDHKFDPIPTSDYYALTGIFRSTKTLTPGNVSGNVMRNLPLPPEQQALLDKHLAVVDQLQAKVDAAKQQLKELGGQATSNVKNVRSEKLSGIVIDDTAAEVIGEWTKSASVAGYVDEGYLHDLASNDGQRRVIYRPRVEKAGRYEVRVSFTIGTNRAAAAPITVWHADGETMMRVDQRKSPNVDGVFHSLGEFRFEPDGPASITIANDGAKGHVIADAVQLLPVGGATNDARRVADASTTEADSDAGSESRPNKRAARRKQVQAELQKLEADLAALKKRAPVEAAQVMSVEEEAEPGDYHICIRGNVHKLGPVVARGALTVASATPALEISPGASGRLELARWIASPDNPLTARVYVNRVWRNLFGAGIVRTPDNFGTTGEAPTHPELLDYLATQFIADGWSTKRLIRHIVLSRTYQLASIDAATDEQL
ncbi:MAG: DUF1549 domain-containing protein, partial [Planctomycetales bacterium]|nr:DUF1549 domain-containing protein [Planctomycetales bacterium]